MGFDFDHLSHNNKQQSKTYTLVVAVQTVKRQPQVAVVHLALRQARRDEFVPVDAGFRLAHAHGVENVFHFFLRQSAQRARTRFADQDLLQGRKRNFSRSVCVHLFKLAPQLLDLVGQQGEAQYFAEQFAHIGKFLEIDQGLDDVRVDDIVFAFARSARPLLQPRVLLRSAGGGAVFGIRFEHVADEIAGGGADVGPDVLRFKVKGTAEDVGADRHEGLRSSAASERGISRQEQKGDDANGPNVAAFVVASADHLTVE